MAGTKIFLIVGCIGCLLYMQGCATPGDTQLTRTRIIDPSQEDDIGGSFVESGDIQTVAARMCPEILSVPEIASNPDVTRIAIAPVRNSTRYIIDQDIFMKRLRLSLNENSGGRVRFFSQESNVAPVRSTVLQERETAELEGTLDAVADYIVASPVLTSTNQIPKIAVVAPKNVNFVNMNAESFVALLRARIAERAAGKMAFLAPGNDTAVLQSADYLLSGEFIAQSLKKEGVVTPFDNLDEAGRSARKDSKVDISVGADGAVDLSVENHESAINNLLDQGFDIEEYKNNPNVTKHLNVFLIDNTSKTVVSEKLFTLERKIEEGLGQANFVLAGELSALSKASSGDRSDYVLVTFQLIDPETNEMIWERGYETKRVTNTSVVYK